MSRGNTSDTDKEISTYLKTGMTVSQVVSMLKAENRDAKEIDEIVEKFENSKKKLSKYIAKFVEKINTKYGSLDKPELMKKGLKFATKHNFEKFEEDAFINLVLVGDVNNQYVYPSELAYTDMYKFLGFSNAQMINIKATDQAPLDEIAQLYEKTRSLHLAVKQQMSMYKPCALEAVTGKFDKDKHNIGVFIHPVIMALFLPKLEAIEKRMLVANFGRMIIQRTAQFLRKYQAYTSGTTQAEMMADLDLMYDIAKDPNCMDYFNEETPINNLLKRFKIQIELYKNVLSLRSGKFYSKLDYNIGVDDAISGLNNILQSYVWTYFDSPDMIHVQDEGTILRKMLAVFSLRPSFIQTSSILGTSVGLMGHSNYATSRLSFVNTPIINIKLPRATMGQSQFGSSIRLRNALCQSEHFIEHKMVVPKMRTVIHSRDMIFFYVNRRYHTLNLTNVDSSFRFLNIPGTVSNITKINESKLVADSPIKVGNDNFVLRSVVVLNKLGNGDFATTGCSSIIISRKLPNGSQRHQPEYWYYNPIEANIVIQYPGTQNKIYSNPPISKITQTNINNTIANFEDLSQKFGTIFVYTNNVDNIN